jgi:transcriptional repressor NrdR
MPVKTRTKNAAAAIPCPACKSCDIVVLDTRSTHAGTAIRRRRACSCGYRFTTLETITDFHPIDFQI